VSPNFLKFPKTGGFRGLKNFPIKDSEKSLQGKWSKRMDCIFCKIAKGEVKSNIIYRDDKVVAFPDINPKAPVHILVIPRKHIASVTDLTEADEALVGHLFTVANKLAKEQGISNHGYRLVVNCGPHGGQLVAHLHLHILGGRQLLMMG
jgi:histidine triad (HIT) family protein